MKLEGFSSPWISGFMTETTGKFFKLFSSISRKPFLSGVAPWQKWRRTCLVQGPVLRDVAVKFHTHSGLFTVGTFQFVLPEML